MNVFPHQRKVVGKWIIINDLQIDINKYLNAIQGGLNFSSEFLVKKCVRKITKLVWKKAKKIYKKIRKNINISCGWKK